ncbi:hypothetical protein M9H77_08345 [Catharanthus roseus]|uniref:Uncharacterized protein n=1 Tax=Catharanthus roseus TaxID=4058 RepID=A0ACC0BXL3_CATRO|nr:hypothetical protein M9H77_08345 [Catharanthus roseus]
MLEFLRHCSSYAVHWKLELQIFNRGTLNQGRNIGRDLDPILQAQEDSYKPPRCFISLWPTLVDMKEHQRVVTRAKAKQLKSHQDQIKQEKFQGLNFDVQDFMGQYAKVLNKLEIGNLP